MLEISDSAAERMLAVLLQIGEEEDACFRVTVTEDGVDLTPDQQRPGDTALRHEDKVVLVMDGVTADLLQDCKIDYDEATSELFFA